MTRRTRILLGVSVSVLAVLVLGAILATFFFPGEKVRSVIEKTAADTLKMPVRIGKAGLSFRGLPCIQVSDITIGPARPGEQALATVKSVRVRIGILPLLKGRADISSLVVDTPVMNLITRKDGTINLSAKTGTPKLRTAQAPQLPVPVTLRIFRMENGAVSLINEKDSSRTTLENISQRLSLRIGRNLESLKTDGELKVGEISLFSGGKRQPVSGVSLRFSHELGGNPSTGDLTLSKGTLEVNGLPITVTGELKGGKTASFHVETGVVEASKLIAALPDSMLRGKRDIRADGTFSLTLDGNALFGETKPVIRYSGAMDVRDMSVAVKGFPKKIDAIRSTVGITDSTLTFRNTEIRIAGSRATLDGTVSGYLEKPVLALRTDGTVSMDDVTAALPVLGENKAQGGITFAVAAAGNTAEPEDLRISGDISFRELSLWMPKVLKNPAVLNGDLRISQDRIGLSGIALRTGKSDFTLTGGITGYMNLMPKRRGAPVVLKGALGSTLVDLNDMLVIDKKAPIVKPWDLDEPLRNLPVPPALEADLAVKLKTVIFGLLKADSADGTVSLRKGVLELSKLNIATYQGALTGKTTLNFSNPEQVVYHGRFDIKNLNAETFLSDFFDTGQHFKGLFSSSLTFNGAGLDSVSFFKNLKGDGSGSLENGEFVNWEFMKQFGRQLKFLNFDTLSFSRIYGAFTVENQRVITPALTAQTEYGAITFDGSTGFDTTVNYDIAFTLNSKASSLAAKSRLGGLEEIFAASNTPELYILAGGRLKSPSFKIDASRSGKTARNILKNKAEELIQKQDRDLQEKGKKLIDKLFK